MADPKRIQVRDRFVTVLDAIQVVDGYYHEPDLVTTKINEFTKKAGKIKLFVKTDEGGEIENHTEAVDETFYIMVEGWIEDSEDPDKKGNEVLNDVRVAVDADAKDPNEGKLGGICLQVVMDESADFWNELAIEGLTVFTQKFRCMITAADFSGL